jgi:RNA polymerase sigma factor (sigma-70 family)
MTILTYDMTDEQNYNISDLLHRLNSAQAGSAWAEFIDRFSPLIMKAVGEFEYRQDRSNECFLFICEKLCDQQFRRLQKYNATSKASFHTWLSVVVFNLCVDWHRREFGRAQMLPAISALPAFDQAVYRICFESGMHLEDCFQILKSDFPDLTRQQLSDGIGRVHGMLTPRQRWQNSVRTQRRNSKVVDLDQLPSPESGPECYALKAQLSENLERAMRSLNAEQRLMLHLRFRQGLTLKKISEVMQLGDPFRVRRQIQSVLEKLSRSMQRIKSATEK